MADSNNSGDPRILYFKNFHVNLPHTFKNLQHLKMIYAAGDGMGGPDKSQNMDKTNIEVYSKLGFNIFCCSDGDYTGNNSNKKYLRENPQLNIVLCILEGNTTDYKILENLFQNSIELIDTDDSRFYPPSNTSYDILITGGEAAHVPRVFVEGYVPRKFSGVYPIEKDEGWSDESKFIKIGSNTYMKMDKNGGKRKRSTRKQRRSKRKSLKRRN